MTVLQWDFRFKPRTTARDPQVAKFRDKATEAAIDYGEAPELRMVIGSRRSETGEVEDPIVEYTEADALSYEVLTENGSTWNVVTFDPPIDDDPYPFEGLASSGRYPYDIDIKPDGETDFETLLDGYIELVGAVQQ